MNARASVLSILMAVMFALAEPDVVDAKCQEVKAKLVEVHKGGNTTSGISTNGGILNGTTATVFNSDHFTTPIATIVSVGSEWTVSTNRGNLKTNNVYLYDLATGLWTALGRIDPNASTGIFAGATGVLYFNGKTLGTNFPFTYVSDVAGEVCSTNPD